VAQSGRVDYVPHVANLFVPDRRDWLRLVGGLLFGVGAVILAIRKLGILPEAEAWSEFAVLLVLLAPFVLLYGLGLAGRVTGPDAEPWQSVFLVFSVILAPFMLFQLLDVIGGDANSSWNSVWIFGITGALGAFAVLWAGATQAGGFGAVALIVAWLAFWDEVLGDPSGNTVRWLLVIVAAIYVAAAIVLGRLQVRQGASLITAAGLATGLAGTLGEFSVLGALGTEGVPGPTLRTVEAADPGAGWDAFLLVTSVALIGFSARTGRRGPGLVGGAGLIAFIVLAGAQLVDQLAGGGGAEADGWPLILVLVGGAALLLSFLIPVGALEGRARAARGEAERPPP
jgi:hypothetical protein